MAADRRRRVNRNGVCSRSQSKVGGRANGSRYFVLNRVDVDEEIMLEGMTQAGGSGHMSADITKERRQSKSTIPTGVKVVSLIEDSDAGVLVHDVNFRTGKHLAMSVIEKGSRQKSRSRSREGFVLSKQHSKENKGLRIKKGIGLCSPPRAVFAEWIPSVSNMIDDEARRMHHGLEQNHDAMDDDDPGRSLTEVRDDMCDPRHGVGGGGTGNFVGVNQPMLVFLLETRVSGRVADNMLWKEEIEVEVAHVSTQFLNCRCRLMGSSEWIQVIAVNASPVARLRKLLWAPLAQLDPDENMPWLLGGNFNSIVRSEESLGGSLVRSGVSRTLNTACAAAPSPVQEKAAKSNQSIFDICRWTKCGGGSCNKTSPFTYDCRCSEGYFNLLNVSAFPCYRECKNTLPEVFILILWF
ncbi:hypothetical protein GQ457_11G000230 [Hibiscus cannabinus]